VREHRLTTVRRARYYTLGGPGDALSPEPPSDVWIAVHGFGQLAAPFGLDFAEIAAPDRLIVLPEALNRFYVEPGTAGSRADARVGATWMTREDRENEIADYVEFLDRVSALAVPAASRLTVLGYSQGVATAARWVVLGSTRVARLIVWAGQIPPDLDLRRLGAAVSEPVVLVTGSEDEYGAWIRQADNEGRLAAAGIPYAALTFVGGHRLDATLLAHLAVT
jgi:predicted esterase